MFVELIPHIFANSLNDNVILSEAKPYLLNAIMQPSQHLKSVDIESLRPVIRMSSYPSERASSMLDNSSEASTSKFLYRFSLVPTGVKTLKRSKAMGWTDFEEFGLS
ncbi:Uncharacterised protein [Salmonella enterica subsp. enterica serovar Typhi]|nr:Uncharacterised protein [Salmonella enterica subsp. enterica serovar Typhi]CQT93647.1 Uncharacterised protein [Salmonella enterica subsp. enterica serovar Typhi]CQU25438.1 Uncharacterised protein [Salmonella enterica subsp. enterica serovar Typhi]CWZ23256.1 Uncharacterised protein [Salmonella enterica subsp. enterica serovar Typhi]